MQLADTTDAAVRSALDPLPDDAPAIVAYRPLPMGSLAAGQRALLADLEAVAATMYPAWLPGAEHIESAGGSGAAAVRALARRAATEADVFAPYLAELAERALRGSPAPRASTFPPDVRAAGAAWAIARGFQRQRLVLLVDPSAPTVPIGDQKRLLELLTWFTYQGRAGVWLTARPADASGGRTRALACPASGRPHPVDGPVPTVPWPAGPRRTPRPARAPAGQASAAPGGAAPRSSSSRTSPARSSLTRTSPPRSTPPRATPAPPSDEPAVSRTPFAGSGSGATARRSPAGASGARAMLPAVVGQPHPASRAERRLENALTARPWAGGRAWNQPYRSTPLSDLHYLDLIWRAERLVVEVDGPEHRGLSHYESDRRRDNELQFDGFVVLRFTNSRIFDDVDTVVDEIERHVQASRQTPEERKGKSHDPRRGGEPRQIRPHRP